MLIEKLTLNSITVNEQKEIGRNSLKNFSIANLKLHPKYYMLIVTRF